MSASRTSIKSSSGMIAMLTMLCAFILGYAYYLEMGGTALDYQADALAPVWYMVKPIFVVTLISEGGYAGTLAAVLLNIVHTIFYACGAYSLFLYGLARSFKPRNKKSSAVGIEINPAVTGLYSCAIEGSTIMVSIPESLDPHTGAVKPAVQDNDPFTQVYMRCARAPVQLARAPSTAIEKVQLAVYELLEAHPTVPASVGHHHADATLKEHSIAIGKVMVGFMKEKGWVEPLARLVGLAHDLDKLLAYQEKKPNEWVKRKDATHHNTYSAYLVAQQPEFALLDADDKFVLTMALRYYHHPARLPMNAGERVERLITAIRHADGNVIQSEKSAGIDAAQASPTTNGIVASAIEQFLLNVDINAHQGSAHAHGWTKDAMEYVIIPMSRIVESIGQFINGDLARQLQLNVESRNFSHPAIPLIRDVLAELQLLMTTHKGSESPTALFDVKVGTKMWRGCVLLDKDRISEMLPTIVPKWGMTKYTVKVVRPTLDKSQSDESSEEE